MVARAVMTLSRMIPTWPLLFIDSERKVLYRGYNTPKSCAIDCRNMATRKNKNNVVKLKTFVGTVGIKSVDLENEFFFLEFRGFPNCLNTGKGCSGQYNYIN